GAWYGGVFRASSRPWTMIVRPVASFIQRPSGRSGPRGTTAVFPHARAAVAAPALDAGAATPKRTSAARASHRSLRRARDNRTPRAGASDERLTRPLLVYHQTPVAHAGDHRIGLEHDRL